MDLQSYTDTKMEVMLLEARVEFLENKKLEIFTKYFGLKSPQWDKIPTLSDPNQDKNILYITEMAKKQNNGLTIDQELEIDKKQLEKAKRTLAKMDKMLQELKGIEYQLYYEIVVNEINVNQAVKRIAENNYMSVDNVYHVYYPKIKAEIHQLRKLKKRGN